MNYNIKLFDIEKDAKLIESFLIKRKESYGHQSEYTAAWFIWKYFTRLDNSSIISCIYDKNEIYGCNSFGNYPLVYNNKIIKSLLSYENFVHPKFQKKGLFKKLIEHSEIISINNRIDLLMAFPNEKSLNGYTNRNWVYKKRFIHYWLKPIYSPLLLSNILDIKKKFIVNNHPPKYKFNFFNFNNRIYKNIYTSFWNKNTLNWRFNEFPQAQYCYVNTDEYESVARVGKRGRLTELQILYVNSKMLEIDKNKFAKLVLLFQNKIKPNLISFPISRENPYSNIMKSIGFFSLRSNTNFVYKTNSRNITHPFRISLSGIDFHTY